MGSAAGDRKPHPYIFAMRLCLIDPPGPFDTLATWLNHLEVLRRLPADTLLRDEMIRTAEAHIATVLAATAFPEFQNPKARMQNVQRHLRARVTIDATEPVSVAGATPPPCARRGTGKSTSNDASQKSRRVPGVSPGRCVGSRVEIAAQKGRLEPNSATRRLGVWGLVPQGANGGWLLAIIAASAISTRPLCGKSAFGGKLDMLW
jgi:hypothetical protein